MAELSVFPEASTEHTLTLALKGALTINYAESMKPVTESYINAKKDLSLNLSQIEDIDVTGIQFLLCLQKNQIEHGRAFRITGLKDQLSRDLTVLGLSGVLI